MERLVASIRDRAANRLWQELARLLTASQRFLLEELLQVPESGGQPPLDRLRLAPTHVSGPGLIKALRRLTDIRAIGVSDLDLSFVPSGRLKQMARYASASRTAQIERMSDDRRIATLLAWASVFEATAQDDALDLLDGLMRSLWTLATRAGERERLRTLRDLDTVALQLRDACLVLLDRTHPDPQVREKVYEQIAENALIQACTRVGELARPAEDEQQYQQLLGKYATVRAFLPTLLRTVTFHATPGARPVLEAVTFLTSIERKKKPPIDEAPRRVIQRSWQSYVIVREGKEEHIDRKAYTICVVERLQEALRRHEVFVAPSERWSDPRANLLQGAPGKPCVDRSVKRWGVQSSQRKRFQHYKRSCTPPISKPRPISLRIQLFALSRKMGRIIWFSLHWIVLKNRRVCSLCVGVSTSVYLSCNYLKWFWKCMHRPISPLLLPM